MTVPASPTGPVDPFRPFTPAAASLPRSPSVFRHPSSAVRHVPSRHAGPRAPWAWLLVLALWLGWQAAGWRHGVLHGVPPQVAGAAATEAVADGHTHGHDEPGSVNCRLLDQLAQAGVLGSAASALPVLQAAVAPRAVPAVERAGRPPAAVRARGPPARA